ncbi:MAG: phosphorybosylanthranilate isomerase, partial [Planctomycetota bacterium]
MTTMRQWFADGGVKPVIGMLHLQPLPGAPGFGGDADAPLRRALSDLDALLAGGVDGVMLENFGDAPFYPGRVPAIVAAHMTRIAAAVRERCTTPLGVNVLRNDARTALAVAHAVGADFIRVNVLCGARVTDQGIIQGRAHLLARDRARLRAEHIAVWADVNVKHSAPLGPPRPIADEVADLCERGGADAIIVSGGGTGRPADFDEVRAVKSAAGDRAVIVGSGVTPESIRQLAAFADGFIVGSALKVDGRAVNPVDPPRV